MKLNKIQIMGRLGRDPEIRYTQSGKACASFSVATDESYKNQSGDWINEVEWHDVVVWGDQAKRCEDNLIKGSLVYVEGKVKTQSWEKDGVKQSKKEIICQFIQWEKLQKISQDNEPQDIPEMDFEEDDLPF